MFTVYNFEVHVLSQRSNIKGRDCLSLQEIVVLFSPSTVVFFLCFNKIILGAINVDIKERRSANVQVIQGKKKITTSLLSKSIYISSDLSEKSLGQDVSRTKRQINTRSTMLYCKE